MDFTDRTILITGSNRGIGRALVARILREDVAKVYAAARNPDTLPDFGDDRVVPLEVDITNQAQVDRAADTASDVDLLINNAGRLAWERTVQGSMEAFRADMEVNHFGTLRMMRAFVPILRGKDAPAIANVLSITSFCGVPFHAGYSASKAAAFSTAQCMRIELAPDGIAVHTINPGPIETDMTAEHPMETADVDDTADRIIEELRGGVIDIFPDDTAKALIALYRDGYEKLEAAAAEVFHSTT